MKLINTITFLLFMGIMMSCDNDELTDDSKDLKQIEYSFVKIEFLKTGQTENIEYIESTTKLEYLNRTSITQTYNHNPTLGLFEISQFSGIDSLIISNIIDPPMISVPTRIENFISFGDAKWSVSNKTEKAESNLNFKSSIQIESNKKMTLNTMLYYRKIKTNFRLILLNKTENKEQTFEGIWIGNYPINVEIETFFTEL